MFSLYYSDSALDYFSESPLNTVNGQGSLYASISSLLHLRRPITLVLLFIIARCMTRGFQLSMGNHVVPKKSQKSFMYVVEIEPVDSATIKPAVMEGDMACVRASTFIIKEQYGYAAFL